MSKPCCPICGVAYEDCERNQRFENKGPCSEKISSEEDYIEYYCEHFDFRFLLHKEIVDIYDDPGLRDRLLNLVTEHMLRSKNCTINGGNRRWHFLFREFALGVPSPYPEYFNLANLINAYPKTVIDVAHRTLMNYAQKYSHYGDIISPSWRDRRMSFEHEINNNHTCGVMPLLEDLGYVKDPDENQCYTITAAGWQKIDELRKEEQIVQQGFIAMSFRDETKPIREAFRKAMLESGYSVAVIDEKEHNNQIVPEIFFEIERSKFVVVDVTYPNYGAYYEAGYAQALGKQVIICCREAEFHDKSTRPHFDISQKSMVVWKDEADLVQRLKRRIEATVR